MYQKVFWGISNVWRSLWDTRNIKYGHYLQGIFILFEKIPEMYLGRNETGLCEQGVKIQTITLWFHWVNNIQLCIITLYWILTIVGAQLGSRDIARTVDDMVLLFRKAVRATGWGQGRWIRTGFFKMQLGQTLMCHNDLLSNCLKICVEEGWDSSWELRPSFESWFYKCPTLWLWADRSPSQSPSDSRYKVVRVKDLVHRVVIRIRWDLRTELDMPAGEMVAGLV